MRLWGLIAAGMVMAASGAGAQEVRVAVAANFTAASQELAQAYTNQTGTDVALSFGSTGTLYTQITQGAPFDAFLAADTERPARLVDEGLADGDSRFTYATGRLALFSTDPDRVSGPETLEGDFESLAIAEPGAAPYGAAAVEVMERLGLAEALEGKLVTGQNIAQTYQFVDTGNAELGFVAYSQIVGREDGSHWLVPQDLYSPIAQDAVLLTHAAHAEAAQGFLDFLQSDAGLEIIESFGYSTGAD